MRGEKRRRTKKEGEGEEKEQGNWKLYLTGVSRLILMITMFKICFKVQRLERKQCIGVSQTWFQWWRWLSQNTNDEEEGQKRVNEFLWNTTWQRFDTDQFLILKYLILIKMYKETNEALKLSASKSLTKLEGGRSLGRSSLGWGRSPCEVGEVGCLPSPHFLSLQSSALLCERSGKCCDITACSLSTPANESSGANRQQELLSSQTTHGALNRRLQERSANSGQVTVLGSQDDLCCPRSRARWLAAPVPGSV